MQFFQFTDARIHERVESPGSVLLFLKEMRETEELTQIDIADCFSAATPICQPRSAFFA